MKRTVFALIFLVLLAIPCMAEKPDYGNEFRIDYGRVSIPGFASGLGTVFGTAFAVSISGDSANKMSMKTTGAIALEYYRHVNPHIALGGEFVWENITMTQEKQAKMTRTNYLTLLPGAKFEWFNHNHFGMYSKVNAGADYSADGTNCKISFAFQASPIGLELGGKQFRWFAEAGLGFQGLLSTGLSYRF